MKKTISRLRAMRMAVGLSGSELARRVGMSRSTLQRLEAGDQEPSDAARVALAMYFKVPHSLLFAEPLRTAALFAAIRPLVVPEALHPAQPVATFHIVGDDEPLRVVGYDAICAVLDASLGENRKEKRRG